MLIPHLILIKHHALGNKHQNSPKPTLATRKAYIMGLQCVVYRFKSAARSEAFHHGQGHEQIFQGTLTIFSVIQIGDRSMGVTVCLNNVIIGIQTAQSACRHQNFLWQCQIPKVIIPGKPGMKIQNTTPCACCEYGSRIHSAITSCSPAQRVKPTMS